MTGEQNIGKGGDQANFDHRDQTGESMGNDSDLGDQTLDHQQRHQEMKTVGHTFQGMNKLYQQQLQGTAGDQVADGTRADDGESVTIGALNPDGTEVKASGKTGLTEKDLIALKDNSLDQVKEVADSSELPPPVSASKMMEVAKREHDHPTRWKGPPPKCNQFLDRVAHEAGMRLPWKPGHPPRSFEMNDKLAKDPNFKKVWKTDYSNEDKSIVDFQSFQMKPGDLIIWDVSIRDDKTGGISHSGIATEGRKIIYAGSATPGGNGCGHCDIKYFTGTPKEMTDYGPPTAIYRYKNMTR